jgi:predicted nucleotidyltransferase
LGEGAAGEAWAEAVKAFLERLRERVHVESAVVHGSTSRGGGGYWSDVDLLVVSDDFTDIPLLERLRLLIELKTGKVEALGYTYEELKRMVEKGNPLALGALIDGLAVVESDRVKRLRMEAEKKYFRRGRAWFPRLPTI